MKIAIFPPSLEGGGVERVAVNLSRGFAEAGIDTDMVMIKAEGRLLPEVSPKVNIVDLKSKRALTSLFPLVRYLRRERPDVLISLSESVNMIAIWAKMLSGTSTALGVVVLNTLSVRQQNTIYRREKLYPALARLFYRRANHIITIAEHIRQDLHEYINLPLAKITTINTPIITPDFYARAEKAIEHTWFNDKDIPVILGVGRFVPQKDLVTLIQAFAHVRQERAARLVILGDGQERGQLESLVDKLGLQDDVWMPGYVDNMPYMKNADVFVLSSIFEGLPTVLIEALALSPAIVSTDCPGGIREILNDGQCGHIVPMKDTEALVKAIIQSLDNPIDESLLRKRANDFKMEAIIDKYRQLFSL